MEARLGIVVEGGQRALNTAHTSGVEGSATKFLQQNNHTKQALNQQPQIGTVNHLLAGGIAGAFSKTCTAPFARLTILFQVQGMHSDVAALSKPCIWHEASRIVNEEGFRAFWKGNLLTITHRLPYSAVNFYAFECYKNLLHSLLGENRRGTTSEDLSVYFVGGGLAGMTAASASYPLDLVRTRLAAQRSAIYYKGIWHAFSTICREEGLLGLYKGLGTTLPNDPTVMVSLACGSLSGIASSTATFPLDLVRRRKQLEGAGGQARIYNTGLFGTFGHIIRNEGVRGLYRGILPEYYKVVPSVGIAFMTYEILKMLLLGIPS